MFAVLHLNDRQRLTAKIHTLQIIKKLMAERLLHACGDFPLQPRSAKAAAKSPELPHYEARDSRMREKLPIPLRGLNQVRFRQFKKQIEGKRSPLDLPRKDKALAAGFGDRERTMREGGSETATPRVDVHKQLLTLLRVLEGAKGSLNSSFQAICGEFGEARNAQTGGCPVCKCTCRGTQRTVSLSSHSDPTVTEICVDSKVFVQECLQCNGRFLHDSSAPEFLCPFCRFGGSSSPSSPGQLALLLDLRVEDHQLPPRSRTPTPPPLDRNVRSPSRSPTSDADRSPRRRVVISPTRRVVSIHRRSDDIRPASKLCMSINGVPIRLIPGDQYLKLILPSRLTECEKRTNEGGCPIPPTPSFHAVSSVFTTAEEREMQGEQKQDALDVSFSQNFLVESPAAETDLPSTELAKSLHSEVEYVLSDHIQIASKHQYVFEIADVAESYVLQYLNLMRRLWKVVAPLAPEAASALEMCVKGLVLVLETTVGALGTRGDTSRRSSDVSEKLQKLLYDLSEERHKSEKLDKTLKNVIRNYEEMISMYSRDHTDVPYFPMRTSRPESVSLDD